jgi:hypothetical protein
MQHMEGSGTPVLYIGRTVFKGETGRGVNPPLKFHSKPSPASLVTQTTVTLGRGIEATIHVCRSNASIELQSFKSQHKLLAHISTCTPRTYMKKWQHSSSQVFLISILNEGGGPGTLVGIATGYGLEGPGIESRWEGARFSAPVQTEPGAHPASCTMVTGTFPGVNSGRGVMLTPHPLIVPWSWKSRAKPLLPLWAVRPVQSLSTLQGCMYLSVGCLVVKRPDNPQTGTPGTNTNRGHMATNPKKTNDEAGSWKVVIALRTKDDPWGLSWNGDRNM